MSQQVRLLDMRLVELSDRELWIRGRVMLVFGLGALRVHPWGTVSLMARDLGVSRQAIYRSCPEMIGTKLDVVG